MTTEQMAKTRLASVDALRGLALFGMLVVHVQYYADGPPVWGDRVQAGVDALFTERFWALFAFLFGVGFALQIERWGDKPGFVVTYVRRLLVLAGFGVLIAAFTGYRVLLGYAFWGVALIAMRRWSLGALLLAAVVIALAGPAVSAVRWQVEKRTIGLEASNRLVTQERGIWRTFHQDEDRIRKEGSFPQLMKHRLRFELGAFRRWTWYIPGPDLLMFVLGLFAVRKGILREPEKHRALLITVVVLGVVLPQAGNFVPRGWVQVPGEPLRLQSVRFGLLLAVMSPLYQGLAYGAVLLLWIVHARGLPRLCVWLSQAGRMSLTNYIVQVCALELLFQGAGLTITRPMGLLVTLVFFAAQVLYSRWWFNRYRIGPAEWLWRSMTYAEVQPLHTPRTASWVIAAAAILASLACDDGPASPTQPPSVRIAFAGSTTRRSDLPQSAQPCVDGVGATHIHPSWRNFAAIPLQPVPPDRYEITFTDVPVGMRVTFRVNDQNSCDENPTGAVTRNVFANDVRLVQNATTPGNGDEPGYALTIAANGTVTQ